MALSGGDELSGFRTRPIYPLLAADYNSLKFFLEGLDNSPLVCQGRGLESDSRERADRESQIHLAAGPPRVRPARGVSRDCVRSQRADDSVTVPPGTDALRRHLRAVPRAGHNRARLPVLARAGPRRPVPRVPAHRGTGQDLPAAAASAAGPRPDRAPGPPGALCPVHRQRAASAVPRPQRGGLPGRCYPRRSRQPLEESQGHRRRLKFAQNRPDGLKFPFTS